MRLLIRFIRIYTPFICTLATLLNGVLFLNKDVTVPAVYLLASLSGSSVAVILYMFVTSMRMCIWYKLNLLFLLLTQICGVAYSYFGMDDFVYAWIVILMASAGLVCFLVFRIFYKVTNLLLCIDSRLSTTKRH